MSDPVKHECGIAFIRLLKPIEYYLAKYGTTLYGLNKLSLLMEKQHNRGQDGAGIACVKLDVDPGVRFMNRLRSNSASAINDIFNRIYNDLKQVKSTNSALLNDVTWLKYNTDFIGELYLGHLRYGTFGKNSIERERRLPGTAQPRNNRHLVARNAHGYVFEVVLAGARDDNPFLAHTLNTSY